MRVLSELVGTTIVSVGYNYQGDLELALPEHAFGLRVA